MTLFCSNPLNVYAGAIERAFEDFQMGKVQLTGCMLHYMVREVDKGPPIITQEVKIEPSDKLEDLERRLHTVEHIVIVKGTKIALEERLAGKSQAA